MRYVRRFFLGVYVCVCACAVSLGACSDAAVNDDGLADDEEDAVSSDGGRDAEIDGGDDGDDDAAADQADDDEDEPDDSDSDSDAEDEERFTPDAGGGSSRGDAARAADDAGASASDAGDAASGDDAGATSELDHFSFFITSLKAMRELSESQAGFGGDLRFGETGAGAGLRGADKICTAIAEKSMEGSGQKGWRAFLSATDDGMGAPVHAIDRIGDGPWYDRLGRVVALNNEDVAQTRPASAHDAIKNDLPNEDGVPNHNPDGTGEVDNHHVLTGSDAQGRLYRDDPAVTCADWTKSERDVADAPRVGLSWPRAGRGGAGAAGQHWLSAMDESGCAPEVSIVEMGPPNRANPTVGSGGGYGAIYCFALTP